MKKLFVKKRDRQIIRRKRKKKGIERIGIEKMKDNKQIAQRRNLSQFLVAVIYQY